MKYVERKIMTTSGTKEHEPQLKFRVILYQHPVPRCIVNLQIPGDTTHQKRTDMTTQQTKLSLRDDDDVISVLREIVHNWISIISGITKCKRTATLTRISHTITHPEGSYVTSYCGDLHCKSELQTFSFSHTSPLISYTIHLYVSNAVCVCCR